jgi:hypothetical protein
MAAARLLHACRRFFFVVNYNFGFTVGYLWRQFLRDAVILDTDFEFHGLHGVQLLSIPGTRRSDVVTFGSVSYVVIPTPERSPVAMPVMIP